MRTDDLNNGWTLTAADRNGRPVSTTHYSGAGQPAPFGWNAGSTGTEAVSYSSNTATAADEAGVSRTSSVDGLGRVTQVENGAGNATTYGYDALDALLQVTHPTGQTR
jgi:YD repeat-containing protein